VFAAHSFEHLGDLLSLGDNARRQESAQSQQIALSLGKSCAFVEQRIMEKIGAAFSV